MSARRVVVTGANGLVGRAVVAALRQSDMDVISVARTDGQDPQAAAVDLGKPGAKLVDAVAPPDAVVHLAAAVPHAARHGDTDAAAAETRHIDSVVHSACAEWKCHAIYASTCGLYDRRDGSIKDEGATVAGSSPYFRAKLAGEALMASLPETCVMRISAPVGRGLRRGLVLAKFIERARAGETIEIWGSGRREQDFVAAADIGAFVAAAISRRVCGVFNVASGHPVTMRELADTVVATVGSGTVRMADKDDPLEAETARFSVARAAQILDWQPRVELREAIADIADAAFPA